MKICTISILNKFFLQDNYAARWIRLHIMLPCKFSWGFCITYYTNFESLINTLSYYIFPTSKLVSSFILLLFWKANFLSVPTWAKEKQTKRKKQTKKNKPNKQNNTAWGCCYMSAIEKNYSLVKQNEALSSLLWRCMNNGHHEHSSIMA